MKIMLLGAGGFIGRHIMVELLAHGHEVIAVVRKAGELQEAFPQATFLQVDLARATESAFWKPQLAGIDVVVNAAGLLRGKDMDQVHIDMPNALYAAARDAGTIRIILISAISARPDVSTDYAASKLAGEAALRVSGLSWTILRPSLVYGDGSYGGTSLMRAMAGFPGFVPLPGNGAFTFTPIHVRDLAYAIRLVAEGDTFAEQTLEPVGPETMSLRDLLARYRGWLGFGRAHFLSVPMPIMRLFARLGDLAGDGPIATNSFVQMVAGNAGDSASFAQAIGFMPQSMQAVMLAHPAHVQDRWHARLFFLAPVLKAGLILMWLVSAWLGLFHGEGQAAAVVHNLGLNASWADPLRIGSSMADIGIAALLFLDRKAYLSTLVQLIVVAAYTLVISLALPQLWLDPLGPLLKNLPVMLAIAAHGAIGNKR